MLLYIGIIKNTHQIRKGKTTANKLPVNEYRWRKNQLRKISYKK